MRDEGKGEEGKEERSEGNEGKYHREGMSE